MINFIHIKKPTFQPVFLLSEEIVNKIKDLLEEYKEEFEGFQIVQNIIDKDAVIKRGVDPPAPTPNIFEPNISFANEIKASKNTSMNRENPNFKGSCCESSNINGLANKESNLEISKNFQINDYFDNLDKNTIKKKYNKSKLSPIN